VRDKRVLIVVATAIALACWAGLIHRDQQQQRAAAAAELKAAVSQVGGANATYNCSEPQSGQTTDLLCFTSTTAGRQSNLIWVEFGGVAALALAFASTPLLQRPRAAVPHSDRA
jgi:hypothetical protein